ncbi:hypothetical protein J1614_002077 [Plenodomus biglobosus]|nr:hypothetical protein J1614_002077 [Plenodomus biglobosus]
MSIARPAFDVLGSENSAPLADAVRSVRSSENKRAREVVETAEPCFVRSIRTAVIRLWCHFVSRREEMGFRDQCKRP